VTDTASLQAKPRSRIAKRQSLKLFQQLKAAADAAKTKIKDRCILPSVWELCPRPHHTGKSAALNARSSTAEAVSPADYAADTYLQNIHLIKRKSTIINDDLFCMGALCRYFIH
jgi:hypothetical protein